VTPIYLIDTDWIIDHFNESPRCSARTAVAEPLTQQWLDLMIKDLFAA
jgi:hypothetical protein